MAKEKTNKKSILSVILVFLFCLLVWDPAKQAINKVFKLEEFYVEKFEYLKSVFVRGDKDLTGQIAHPQKWNFATGTIVFHLLAGDCFNGKTKKLEIVSEDKQAYIKFLKDQNDQVSFTIFHPSVGRIVRTYQLSPSDIAKRDTTLFSEKKELESVFLGFGWNLVNNETRLWINAIEIDYDT